MLDSLGRPGVGLPPNQRSISARSLQSAEPPNEAQAATLNAELLHLFGPVQGNEKLTQGCPLILKYREAVRLVEHLDVRTVLATARAGAALRLVLDGDTAAFGARLGKFIESKEASVSDAITFLRHARGPRAELYPFISILQTRIAGDQGNGWVPEFQEHRELLQILATERGQDLQLTKGIFAWLLKRALALGERAGGQGLCFSSDE